MLRPFTTYALQKFNANEFIYTRRMMASSAKAATTVEDVCKLVDEGFEYVCDVGDAKVFRKRK